MLYFATVISLKNVLVIILFTFVFTLCSLSSKGSAVDLLFTVSWLPVPSLSLESWFLFRLLFIYISPHSNVCGKLFCSLRSVHKASIYNQRLFCANTVCRQRNILAFGHISTYSIFQAGKQIGERP